MEFGEEIHYGAQLCKCTPQSRESADKIRQLETELNGAKEDAAEAWKAWEEMRLLVPTTAQAMVYMSLLEDFNKQKEELTQTKLALESVNKDCTILEDSYKRAMAIGLEQKAKIKELLKDKERLDWMDKNNVSMNRLKEREARLEYWHIYWQPDGLSGCNHSGTQEDDYKNLRLAIDTAMEKGK